MVPRFGVLVPINVRLVIHNANDVADDEREHEVLVDPESIALQRSGRDGWRGNNDDYNVP